MEPRLSTSRKWTALPEELVTQIHSVFKQSFKEQIGAGELEVGGRIYPEEILISVGFRAQKALKQANFVVSLPYQRNKDNVLKLLHLGIDAMASLFEQYFAAENDTEFPTIWEEVDFEGRKISIQYHTVNSTLEAEADRLLGLKKAEELAQGDWDDVEGLEPEHIKAQLGIDDEDGDGEKPDKH